MTLVESGQVMDLLTAAYPRYYAGLSDGRRSNALRMWAVIFADDNLSIVLAAVRSFIESDEKGFPPVPGQIKAKLRMITEQGEMTEADAWNLVAKAIRNSGYEARREFEKLPPLIRRIVGSPNQLREWGLMDSETVHSVVSSNFQRSYRAIAAKERELQALPEDVKRLVMSLRPAQESTPELPKAPGAEIPQALESEAMPEAVRRRIAEIFSRAGRAQGAEPTPQPTQKRSREEVIALLKAERRP